MSNTDETISIRPPLPVCCALLYTHRQPGPSHHLGSCSRCGRDVSVNTRMNTSMLDDGIEVRLPRLVCVDCWTGADQAIVLSYRDVTK